MKTKLKSIITRVVALALAFITGSALADTTGVLAVNFRSDAGKVAEGSSETVLNVTVPAAAWFNSPNSANQSTPQTLTAYDIANNVALGQSAMVAWSANVTWHYDSATSPLLKGYLDDGGSGATVNFSNIPFAFYDVIVVSGTDNGNCFQPIQVNSTSYTYDSTLNMTVEGVGTWGAPKTGTIIEGKNALKISKCTGPTLTVYGTVGTSNDKRGGIAAVLIVERQVESKTIEGGDYIRISEANKQLDGKLMANIVLNAGATVEFDAEAQANFALTSPGAVTFIGYPGQQELSHYNFTDIAGGYKQAARVIAVNFSANANNRTLAADADATVPGIAIPGKGWTQVSAQSNAGRDYVIYETDTQTTTTSASGSLLSWSSANNYQVGNNSVPILEGYLDDGGSHVHINLTNVPFDAYDVIIFGGTDTNGRGFAPYMVNGVLYTSDANGRAVRATSLDRWGETRVAAITFGKNAFRVNNLVGDLAIAGGKNDSGKGTRGGVAAIVIIERSLRTGDEYIFANGACDATNDGGVGGYKPTQMTIPAQGGMASGMVLGVKDVTLVLEGTGSAKSPSITLNNVVSGGPAVGGSWYRHDMGALGNQVKWSFATPVDISVGQTVAMTAAEDSRIRLYKTTADKWGYINLNKSMDQWRPAYAITTVIKSARSANTGSVSSTCDWGSIVWEEGAWEDGIVTVLTVDGTATVTAATPVTMKRLRLFGSGDLTLGAGVQVADFDLSQYAGKLTIVCDEERTIGGVAGGTVIKSGSATLNVSSTSGTVLEIESGMVKYTDAALADTSIIIDEDGELENYGWPTITGTFTLTTDYDKTIFSNPNENPSSIQGGGAIVKNGKGTVTVMSGTAADYASAQVNGGALIFNADTGIARLLSGEGTVAAADGVTVTIAGAGEGTVNVGGPGTIAVGDARFADAIFNFVDDCTLSVAENIGDDGLFVLRIADNSIEPSIEFPGEYEDVSIKDGVLSFTYKFSVKGTACWMDYEFNGNLENIGIDTTALSRDQDNGRYIYGNPTTNDFRCIGRGVEGTNDVFDALYAGSHPYRRVTYPTGDWTCALYGTLPQADNSALVMFGSTTDGTCGLIGLMTGSVADNEVLLVRSTGSQNNATRFDAKENLLAKMKVPNAFTSSHLYIFTKHERTVTVYLDGEFWSSFTADSDFVLGTGLQICSIHGGTFKTGINRFYPGVFADGIEDPRSKACVIDMMRLYKCVLGPNAIAALKAECDYKCPNGNFERAFSGEGNNWVTEEGSWTKDGEIELFNQPAAGSKIAIAANDEASLTVNLDGAVNYESLTFDGEGSLKIAKGTGEIVNAGKTTVKIPLSIEAGAISISGGPTALEGDGSLDFDFTNYDFTQITKYTFIQLTGNIVRDDEKVKCTLPTGLEQFYTIVEGYDEGSSCYRITIEPVADREGVQLYVEDPSRPIDDNSLFVTAGGLRVPRLDKDILVVPEGMSAKVGDKVLAIPIYFISGSGTLICDGVFPSADFAAAIRTNSTWTGTVWFMNKTSVGGQRFSDYRNESSTVRLTNMKGWLSNGNQGPVELVDGENGEYAFEQTDSSNGYVYTFDALTGSGTLKFATVAESTAAMVIKDVSNFTGKLLSTDGVNPSGTATHARPIYIGETGTATSDSLISVANGKTIIPRGWEASAVQFGSSVAIDLETEPTASTPVKIVDGVFEPMDLVGTTINLTINGLPVQVEYMLTQNDSGVFVTVSTVKRWTGNAGNTDWSDAMNWNFGVPEDGDVVRIDLAGEMTLTLPDDGVAALSALAFGGAGSIAADPAKFSNVGTISVANGVVITFATDTAATLQAVSGDGALVKSGVGILTLNACSVATTVEAGTLAFDVNEGEEMTVSSVISGEGAVAKTGLGTLTLMPVNTYTGGTIVEAGTLKFGGTTNDSNKGPIGPYELNATVWPTNAIVKAGAALDLNGVKDITYGFVLEDGAIFKNGSATGIDDGNRQTKYLVLDGDATVDATGAFGLHNGGNALTKLDLGENTLTKAGEGNFDLVNTLILGAGTINVTAGKLRTNIGGSVADDATINLDGGSLQLDANLTVKNLIGVGEVYGNSRLTVKGMFDGTVNAANVTFGNDATIHLVDPEDYVNIQSTWVFDGNVYLDITKEVLAANAPAARKGIEPVMVSWSDAGDAFDPSVIKIPAELKQKMNAENVTLAIDTENKCFKLARASGILIMVK